MVSLDHLRFVVKRFRERLWIRPLAVCIVSVGAVFSAKFADNTFLTELLPSIQKDSVETLLSLMAASMLVIATFSVASMISAYASASGSATPRAFTLVVADDVSQNALSTFVGTFIFSVVALTAVKNAYYEKAGLFILFALTIFCFSVVIVTFVKWVDNIARLGRIGSTIEKVEEACANALLRRKRSPRLGGINVDDPTNFTKPIFAESVGYVQHIDTGSLQKYAKQWDIKIRVAVLPGTFVVTVQPLAYLDITSIGDEHVDPDTLRELFVIGNDRTFEDDPRFGLVVLSEIAGRALSPAVNDPGTAIKVIGTMVRLFTDWQATTCDDSLTHQYDRIAVPELTVEDMFTDAFTAIARDGAGITEVSIRLQKALVCLQSLNDPKLQQAARAQSQTALARSLRALELDFDKAAVQAAAISGGQARQDNAG